MTKVLRVAAIKKKCSATVFKDLKVGDKVLLSVKVDGHGCNRNQLKVTNLGTGEYEYKYFKCIKSILERFDFEEVSG